MKERTVNYLIPRAAMFGLLLIHMVLSHNIICPRAEHSDFRIVKGVLEEYIGSDETIVIPDEVKTIGSFAFSFSQARRVIIPDSVTKIEEWAFFYMPNLESLDISSNVTNIEEGAFLVFPNFKTFNVDKSNDYYTTDSSKTMLLSKNKKILYAYPGASGNIKNLPKELTRIGNLAFYSNKNITKVSIPNTVKSIGSYAFGYTTMESITLPNKLTSIELGAFCYSENITEIMLPKTLRKIGNYAFADCRSLQAVVFQSKKPPEIDLLSFKTTSLFSYVVTLVIPKGTLNTYRTFINSYESGNEMLVEAGEIAGYSSSNIITMLKQPGYEYSLNGKKYQSNPVFEGLKPSTKYTVYMRKAATSTKKAGKTVKMTIKTKKGESTFYDSIELY